jgi:DNA invertase Pin-like site-specific DNA recombinase
MMNRYKQREDSSPLPGAAYIRFSSEMQSDSFSLDAQLRQIKEQAERDGVEIVKVYADPAQSAYRKKYRPGINAMREAARRGEFKVLYVHKVDRLARRLEWSLEIVHELQELDIIFKAVQQPFDLGTPEGKLLFHLVSSLGEFYSDNLSKETNKGKLERSLQGYHNGAVPWGYISVLQGNRKVGVPDPEKAPVVVEMFERYATGQYSDMQIAAWLNKCGYLTAKNRMFNKDSVRDMLCNPYFVGKIRYRGMTVRPKGSAIAPHRPRYPMASTSRSSTRSCGIAVKRYVPAGVWFPNPGRRQPEFTCCKAWQMLPSRLSEALPVPVLQEWAETLWEAGIEQTLITELMTVGDSPAGFGLHLIETVWAESISRLLKEEKIRISLSQ